MNETALETSAKHSVGWSITVSIAMILAGMAAIFVPAAAGIMVTVLAGYLLVLSGIAHFLFGWDGPASGILLWETLLGILYILAGSYILFHLAAALAVLTIVLGIYLFLEAILEFLLWYRLHPLPGSGWLAFDGILTLALAILVWRTWSAAWAIGVLVGISILFSGISRLMLSLGARRAIANLR